LLPKKKICSQDAVGKELPGTVKEIKERGAREAVTKIVFSKTNAYMVS